MAIPVFIFAYDDLYYNSYNSDKKTQRIKPQLLPSLNSNYKKGQIPYVVGGNSLSFRNQSIPRPNRQRITSCVWDKDRFLCGGSEGAAFVIYMNENALWSDDVYTIINNAYTFLNRPESFVYNPQTNNFELNLVKPTQSMKETPFKENPFANAIPIGLVGKETPLNTLSPGQFKAVINNNPLNMGVIKGIFDSLRPVLNSGNFTFAGGAPVPYHMFLVQPKDYINMPFSNSTKKYDMKFKDGRGLPRLYMRDYITGDSYLAIALQIPPFQRTNPNFQPESPIISSIVPAGPGAEDSTPLTISQEITNALQNGNISWQVFLEIFRTSFSSDSSLNIQTIPVTNKDGTQVGFIIARSSAIGSNNPANYVLFLFTDDKRSDGIVDTLHVYLLNPNGSIKEEVKIKPPIPPQKK